VGRSGGTIGGLIVNTLRKAGRLLVCTARFWSADNAAAIGASLAFYCAFSLAPLLIILLTVAGLVVGADAAYSHIVVQLRSLFGPATATILVGAMKSSQHTQGIVATVTSVVTLLIGSTTVLSALQESLDKIWSSGVSARHGWLGWLQTRFLSLGFILALGFLLLVSLTIASGLSALRSRIAANNAPMIGALATLDFAISLVLVTSLFALIYRYLPARRLPWKTVVVGGIVTAVLFDAGRWALGVYLAKSTQPSAFGAASSFAALLLWLYYTAQIFLFGAEFTACLGGLRNEKGTTVSDEATPAKAVGGP